MALPSQGGFSSVRQGGSYRRRRRSRGTSWLVLFAVAACTTWYLWPDPDSDEGLDTPIPIAGDFEGIATPPKVAEDPTFVEMPVEQEPVVVAVVEELVEMHEPVESSTSLIPLAATTSDCLEAGMEFLDKGQIIQARQQLSGCLRSGVLSESEISQARGVLEDLSDRIIFSPSFIEGDPFALEYIVRGGDTLSGIVRKMGLQVDWRFIKRINGISQASSIRAGQNLKLITGPFHAVVDKSTFRIDLYLGDGDEQVFVCSYRVGLGEFNSTPKGLFKVRKNSKLVNPSWVNPRTREYFSADNEKNPIGERWIGLKGMEERTMDLTGLGIHGTIEPESIGTNASMGCVRMHEGDVAIVYEMLLEGVSTVEIH